MSIGSVLRQRTIGQLDLAPAFSVESRSTLGSTLEAMRTAGRGAALIVEDGQLAGIFTERDLVTRIVGSGISDDVPIRQVMTPAPETLRPDASVFEAIQLMERQGYRNVPIVDETGCLLGILPVSSIVDFLAESFPQEVLSLPPRADQHFVAADGA